MLTNLIPLNRAYLCEECSQIGDRASVCAGCGSQALLGLARVLNRAEIRFLEALEQQMSPFSDEGQIVAVRGMKVGQRSNPRLGGNRK